MRRYVINYDGGAKSDILNIIDYIEEEYDDSYNAAKVATRILRRCEALARFPKGYPIRPDWSSKRELRSIHTRGYTIIYYVDDEKLVVNIIAVINSRRDIVSLIRKK